MGFKLPGKSMTSGTSGHSSALKMRSEEIASAFKYTTDKGDNPPKTGDSKIEKPEDKKMANKDWKKGQDKAKSSGRDLNALVKSRKSMKKGSDEYNVVQNQINKALGSKKTHGSTSKTTTEGKTKTTSKVTPGLSTDVSTTKTTRGGKKSVKKRNLIKDNENTTFKTKTIKTSAGDLKKRKSTIKSDYDKDGKVDKKTKLKTKYNADETVKKEKRVTREGGRRTVTKTDAEGNKTTKSRRTLKGFLTGKGKKKKEDSPADMKDKY